MCSDAQLWMTEVKAPTYEEKAPEFIESASTVVTDDSAERAPASEPGIGRVAAYLYAALAWGRSLIRLLRQGRKDGANFRKNALSHARRQPAD